MCLLVIERDFIVTKTKKGRHCLLRGQYRHRKAREIRGGIVIWRCTKSSCNALLKTDIKCTTLLNSRNTHNHKEISWEKLAREEFHKDCQCQTWGVNSSEFCPLFSSISSSPETYNN